MLNLSKTRRQVRLSSSEQIDRPTLDRGVRQRRDSIMIVRCNSMLFGDPQAVSHSLRLSLHGFIDGRRDGKQWHGHHPTWCCGSVQVAAMVVPGSTFSSHVACAWRICFQSPAAHAPVNSWPTFLPDVLYRTMLLLFRHETRTRKLCYRKDDRAMRQQK